MSVFTRIFFIIIAFVSLILTANLSKAAEHKHQAIQSKKEQTTSCKGAKIVCAKTVTTAFSPNGDLWRLWALNSSMYFQISHDNGLTFSDTNRVAIDKEKISARNENRPKNCF